MTTTTRRHSVHIQAPVTVVFKHIEDPQQTWGTQAAISELDVKPEGLGTTWKWVSPLFGGLQLTGTMTRTDQVVDSRIVEESTSGPKWIWTLRPGRHDDTELTLEMDYSLRFPLADKAVMVTVGRHTDEEMQQWLTAIKMAVES